MSTARYGRFRYGRARYSHPLPIVIFSTPTATAAALTPVPLVRLNPLSPSTSGTGSASTPAVRTVIGVPVASASATSQDPTLLTLISVPVAQGLGSAQAPRLSIAQGVAGASGQGLPPYLPRSIVVPLTSAISESLSSTIETRAAILNALASADTTAPSVQNRLSPPVISGTAQASVPSNLRTSYDVPTALSNAAAYAPVLRVQGVSIADGVATGAAPTLTTFVRPNVALALGDAPPVDVPIVGVDFYYPPRALAAAQAPAPTLSIVYPNVGVAPSTGAGVAPTMVELTLPVASAAVAAAPAPTTRTTFQVSTATAVASGIEGSLRETVFTPQAPAQGVALNPTLQIISGTAGASGSGQVPTSEATYPVDGVGALGAAIVPEIPVIAFRIFEPPVAAASGTSNNPVQSVRVSNTVAQGVGDPLDPTTTALWTVMPGFAATAAPVPGLGVVVVGPSGSGSAQSPIPTVEYRYGVPISEAIADAEDADSIILYPAATGSGDGLDPRIAVTISSEVAQALGQALEFIFFGGGGLLDATLVTSLILEAILRQEYVVESSMVTDPVIKTTMTAEYVVENGHNVDPVLETTLTGRTS